MNGDNVSCVGESNQKCLGSVRVQVKGQFHATNGKDEVSETYIGEGVEHDVILEPAGNEPVCASDSSKREPVVTLMQKGVASVFMNVARDTDIIGGVEGIAGLWKGIETGFHVVVEILWLGDLVNYRGMGTACPPIR